MTPCLLAALLALSVLLPATASADDPPQASSPAMTVLPPIEITGRRQRPVQIVLRRSEARYEPRETQTSFVSEIRRSVTRLPF